MAAAALKDHETTALYCANERYTPGLFIRDVKGPPPSPLKHLRDRESPLSGMTFSVTPSGLSQPEARLVSGQLVLLRVRAEDRTLREA